LTVLSPAILVGYVLWIVKAFAGRKAGVSATAQGPLSARWFQHMLGVRSDEPAHRLMMALPGISLLALRLVLGPILLASRLSGYVPGAFRYPFEGEVTLQNQTTARQTFYDSTVDRWLADIPQFIILGAGFDTRAFRLPEEMRHQKQSFEVDTPQTQATKREILHRAGVDSAGVAFVSADFEKEDWFGKLVDAGFNPDQTALFIWEGVTPYLEKAAVEATLRKISGAARGSMVAFDYFTTEVLESPEVIMQIIRTTLRAGGESLKFGIDSTPPLGERVDEFVRSCGLALIEQHTAGRETGKKRAWGGFAIASVK
jgi:methyltransferase (TIGR00027 family)